MLNPIWGHLADSVLGRRTSLQIGLLASAAFALTLAGADALVWIAAAGFLLAGSMVTFGPNVDAIALEHLGASRMSEYGRIRSWESFTYAIGCLLFGATFQAYGIDWAMPVFAIASVVVFLWSFTVPRDASETRRRRRRPPRRGRRGLPRGAAILGVPPRALPGLDGVQCGMELHLPEDRERGRWPACWSGSAPRPAG